MDPLTKLAEAIGVKSEDKKISLPMIGHHKPKRKITRDAFLYMDHEGDKEKFASCSSCVFWTGSEHNTCGLHGKDVKITADMSCGFYVHGDPSPENHGKEAKLVTTTMSGLVDEAVQCRRCALFDKDDSYCELFEHLNKTFPDNFNLKTEVCEYGCCNSWVGKDND